MRPTTFSCLAAFATIMLAAAQAPAVVLTIEIITEPDPGEWALTSPWRNEGGVGEVVFDANNTNSVGFFDAAAPVQNLTTAPAVTAQPGYNPSTTKLIGFDTPAMDFSYRTVALGNLAGSYEYKLFIEIDVNTTGGTYRLKTLDLDATTLPDGNVTPTWAWQGGPFLGDLTAAGGVALADITAVSYKLFMFVVDPSDAGDTAFLLVSDLSLQAQVSVVPAPAAASAGLVGLALIALRRRRVA